jgi:hypothetical protein
MLTSIQNLPLLLVQNGSPDGEVVLGALVALVFTIILALVAYLVTRTILLRFVVRAISRARANWGEILLERKVFHLLSLIAPVCPADHLARPARWQVFAYQVGQNSEGGGTPQDIRKQSK